jgi:hypothetical protein
VIELDGAASLHLARRRGVFVDHTSELRRAAKRVDQLGDRSRLSHDLVCNSLVTSFATGFLLTSHGRLAAMRDSTSKTAGGRLRQARRDAGFKSARSAALRFGWTPSTYASHENGQTPVPTEAANEYAKAFGVHAAWLITGDDPGADRVRVTGWVTNNGEVQLVGLDDAFWIYLQFGVDPQSHVLQVTDKTLAPRFRMNDIVLASRYNAAAARPREKAEWERDPPRAEHLIQSADDKWSLNDLRWRDETREVYNIGGSHKRQGLLPLKAVHAVYAIVPSEAYHSWRPGRGPKGWRSATWRDWRRGHT